MRRAKPKADDWRSDRERAFDAKLTGVWWRCICHGLLSECIPLGGVAYCPFDHCDQQLLVVSQPGVDRSDWKKGEQKAAAPEHQVLARDPHGELPARAGGSADAAPPPADPPRAAAPAHDVEPAWLEQVRRRHQLVLDGLAEDPVPDTAIAALDELLLEDLPRVFGATGRYSDV